MFRIILTLPHESHEAQRDLQGPRHRCERPGAQTGSVVRGHRSGGQQLQLVSQLLAVDPRGTDAGVDRFCDVADRLKSQEERVGPSRYDEVALLALTQGVAADVVDRVIQNRDRLRQAKSRPGKSVAFTLAAGIELSADTERAGAAAGAAAAA